MNNIETIANLQAYNEITHLNSIKLPSFKLKIKRYVTDTDGTIQNKTWLPLAARTQYPVFLFNAYDNSGGYYQGLRLLPLPENIFFIASFTYGNSFQLLNFSGGNNIKNQLNIGDQVLMFSNSEQFPSFFVWVVISGELRSYGSILNNPLAQGLQIHSMQFFADNKEQFQQSITVVNQNEVGNVSSDDFTPQTSKTIDYKQENFIVIPFNKWKLTNYKGLYFPFNFSTNLVTCIFRYFKP